MINSREGVETYRRTATIVGGLFIVATVLFFIGKAVYGPATSASDYLDTAYPDRATVTLGILFEFVCVLAIPLIGMFAFPVLKRVNEALAVAYVGFRSLEAVLLIIVEAKLLSLIDVSQRFLESGEADASRFQVAGDAILSEIDGTFVLYVLVFAVGALMFYSMLYTSRLVPRFVSTWGFASAALMLGGTAFVMYGTFSGATAEAIIVIPLALNEMVLALWLILKGFDRKAISAIRDKAPAMSA